MTVKPRVSGSSKPSAASIGDSDGGFAPPPSAPIQVSGGLDLRRLRSFKGVWLFLRQIRGQVWGGSSGDESGEWSFIVLSLFFVVSYYSPVVEIEHLLPLVGWFLLHSVYFHPNHMDNPIIVCLFSSTGSGLGLICSPLGEFWAIKISQFGIKKKKKRKRTSSKSRVLLYGMEKSSCLSVMPLPTSGKGVSGCGMGMTWKHTIALAHGPYLIMELSQYPYYLTDDHNMSSPDAD